MISTDIILYMDLNELRDNILVYQSRLGKYIESLIVHKPLASKIEEDYKMTLNEHFCSPNPSIEIDPVNKGYSIYIQMSVNENFFGLWFRNDFIESKDYSGYKKSLLIKFLKDDKLNYKSVDESFKVIMPKKISNRLQYIDIVLDPYSIHFIIHITDL